MSEYTNPEFLLISSHLANQNNELDPVWCIWAQDRLKAGNIYSPLTRRELHIVEHIYLQNFCRLYISLFWIFLF